MAGQVDIFTDAKARQESLLNLLASQPIVYVLGVVNASGMSGGMFRGDVLWTLKLTLAAWRIQNAGLLISPLTLRRKVTNESLAELREWIKPYNVIRIRARVITDSSFGDPEGLLEAFDCIDGSDTELNEFAKQLQAPVNHVDSILGTFTLDRRVNWFVGSAGWNGKPVSIYLNAIVAAELQAALKTAHSLWEAQDIWNERVCDYAAEALLPLKNKNWLAENEVTITADQFKQKMTIESLTVNPNGSFEFSHSDGDLFGGHSIQTRGSLSKGLTKAGISG